jgi:ATP-dependent Clp protease protease subunit
VAELTVRINSPGGSVFDGVAINNALKRHPASVTVWIDGIAASIASMIAMAGDEVVMPENAMLMLHDPSGLVAGTAADMRATADALDKMATAMIAAYRDKSDAGDAEIAALMAAETWLSAEEAVELGLADRVEAPLRMAAHFDLSRFRNPPSQLAALASVTAQEDEMSDSRKTRPRKPDTIEPTAADATGPTPGAEQIAGLQDDQPLVASAEHPRAPDGEPADATVAPQSAPTAPAALSQPTAQVIDLDTVRADERRATLAYAAEVHELCAIAGRGDLAIGFVAKATPVTQVRRALLEARAAEDEATAIRSQVRPPGAEHAPPAIDTAAIYAARNQHCR